MKIPTIEEIRAKVERDGVEKLTPLEYFIYAYGHEFRGTLWDMRFNAAVEQIAAESVRETLDMIRIAD